MIFFNNKENISLIEAFIRSIVAMGLVYMAITQENVFLFPISAFLLFTAVSKSCIIYDLLGVNKAMLKLNYYLNFLPIHNPSPVSIFTAEGNQDVSEEVLLTG
jgi:hypothetical protein